MQAEVGDRVVIPGRHVGEAERIGEVLECRGENGGPPYLVRWTDGHEGLLYPGAEARMSKPSPR